MTQNPNLLAGEVVSAAKALENFDVLDPAEAVTFFVGWLSGKSYYLRQLQLHLDVEKAFREIASDTLKGTEGTKGILERESEPWTPDAQIFPETYLECSVEQVGESPKLTKQPEKRFLRVLQEAENLPLIDAKDAVSKTINLYGFAIGPIGERIVFIRRANPQRGLQRGKILGMYSDTLRRINDPVFAFDSRIDLVVAGERLVVLSQNAFLMLFRSHSELQELVPKWGETLDSQFPIEPETRKRIIALASRDSRFRQRLESIVTRGHLENMDRERLEESIKNCLLDPEKFFIAEDKLVVEEGNEADFLCFLNEDLYQGIITGDQFRADKKASR